MVSSPVMIRGLWLLLSLLLCSVSWAQPVGSITAEQWSRPRHGEGLVDMPGLNTAIDAYLRRADGQIVIHHPAEEEGLFWAEELKGWLTALGVESSAIRLVPAPVPGGVIEIYIE